MVLARLHACDVMATDAITVAEHESLAAAWEVLARAGCRFLPVLRGSRVVGVIDDHAVVCARTTRWLDGRQRLVGDAASPARTVHATTPLPQVIEVMARNATSALVVVDDGGSLVGLVTADSLLGLIDRAMACDGNGGEQRHGHDTKQRNGKTKGSANASSACGC
jgi:acetoin utilization protein AcuB